MSTITATTRISDTERAAWIAWLKRLGIDPYDVAVPGFVERDVSDRCVRWEGFIYDSVTGEIQLSADGNSALRVERFVQLEAVPPPFPAEAIPAASARGEAEDVLMIIWEDRS